MKFAPIVIGTIFIGFCSGCFAIPVQMAPGNAGVSSNESGNGGRVYEPAPSKKIVVVKPKPQVKTAD